MTRLLLRAVGLACILLVAGTAAAAPAGFQRFEARGSGQSLPNAYLLAWVSYYAYPSKVAALPGATLVQRLDARFRPAGLEVISFVEERTADADTKAVAMFGEIGGTQEERVADMMLAGEFTKPLVAFIGGKAAKSGTRFSHAGAIVEGNRGTHEGKVARLREAGAVVVDAFDDLPGAMKDVLATL